MSEDWKRYHILWDKPKEIIPLGFTIEVCYDNYICVERKTEMSEKCV